MKKYIFINVFQFLAIGFVMVGFFSACSPHIARSIHKKYPALDQGFIMEENTFYRSEYDFGSYNSKSPLIIVSLQMAKELTAQKFKGLYFKDVLE